MLLSLLIQPMWAQTITYDGLEYSITDATAKKSWLQGILKQPALSSSLRA